MTLALRYAARSHTGLIREGNEDSVYAGPRVLAVADGMGGHAAGEVASAVAIASIAGLDDDDPGADLLDALARAAREANEHLRDMVEGDPGLDGMGTTLTSLLFAGGRLGVLHVGDSRCYLLRDGELTQITHDHTLVQTLVDDGRISEEEASTHPQRSLITRALDGRREVELDLSVREARDGDRYLLCTDGLTGPVARLDTLRDALQIEDPQESCDRLVQLALRGGGPDNVTVIVADVVDARGRTTSAPVVAGAAADAPQPPPPGVADSAAGRARAAEGRAPADEAEPVERPAVRSPPPARRSRGRTGLVLGLVGLLLLAGAGAGYAYVRSQYYVGTDGEAVAVYRGVTGEVAGRRLSSVEERTGLETGMLDEISRGRVERGIVAADRDEADEIVRRLAVMNVPACAEDPEVPTLDQLPAATPTPTAAVAAPGALPSVPPPVPPPSAAPSPVPTVEAVPCPVALR